MAKSDTALSVVSSKLPAEMLEFGGGPTGLENVTASDLIIPRLTILQALSPQLQKTKPEHFIAGAEAGDFCDVSSGNVYKGELLLLPCAFVTVYLEWAPRNSGKGLVHNHGQDDSILKECKKDDRNRQFLPNGNYIAQTAQFYVLNMTPGAGGQRSYIPLAATQLQASRKWLSQIYGEQWGRFRTDQGEILKRDGASIQAPLYYRLWKAKPVSQSNNDGTWYGWRFSAEGEYEGDDVAGKNDYAVGMLKNKEDYKNTLAIAKEFCAQAISGEAKGDTSTLEEETVASNDPAGKDDRM